MLCLKYDKIWKLIKENLIEIDVISYNYLTCLLCGKIMINACEGQCGCKFCLNCIKEYITEKKNLYCPGSKDKCNNIILNINENIIINDFINYIIMKIVVKCPEKPCEFEGKLEKIPKHLKICKHHCQNKESSNVLKSKPIFVENTFDEPISYKFGGFDENINNEIRLIKKEIEDLKLINKKLIEEIEVIKNKSLVDKKIGNSFEDDNNKFFSIINNTNENKSKFIKSIEDNPDIIQLKNNNKSKYLWKIENFSEKRKKARFLFNTEINSDPFFSHENGYKMSLSAYPNGFGIGSGSHLSVVFRLLKGPHDNQLDWPMKFLINVALIDQETGNIHCSSNYDYSSTIDNMKYVFYKPTTKENRSFGSSKFINLDNLIGNSVLCKNDRIILQCTVNVNTK